MKKDEALIDAMMHLEYAMDAHECMMLQPDAESWAAKKDEVSARMTAAHYLVQFARSGSKPDNYDESMARANSYNPKE